MSGDALCSEMYNMLVINGPNLNMLGVREPEIYGDLSLEQINARIMSAIEDSPMETEFYQSNHEGSIIDTIQNAYYDGVDGIVINPAAFTHYSYAIRDAIASVPIPFVEVHLSDISSRESFRQVSVTADVCEKQIAGKGWEGYVEALKYLMHLKEQQEAVQ